MNDNQMIDLLSSSIDPIPQDTIQLNEDELLEKNNTVSEQEMIKNDFIQWAQQLSPEDLANKLSQMGVEHQAPLTEIVQADNNGQLPTEFVDANEALKDLDSAKESLTQKVEENQKIIEKNNQEVTKQIQQGVPIEQLQSILQQNSKLSVENQTLLFKVDQMSDHMKNLQEKLKGYEIDQTRQIIPNMLLDVVKSAQLIDEQPSNKVFEARFLQNAVDLLEKKTGIPFPKDYLGQYFAKDAIAMSALNNAQKGGAMMSNTETTPKTSKYEDMLNYYSI